MGVHGLWELLAPVGRRVSVETLAGKKLAIDASIWIIQFMKAMRDEKGEMVRNAHILGFFRRICKLLYLRTKPVFVFDGGTPALKRRTVIARRRQRENAQVKIRKTAEKLLLNHLKTMRLQELAANLKTQRQENDIKGKKSVELDPEVGNQKQDDGGVAANLKTQRQEDDIKGKRPVGLDPEVGNQKQDDGDVAAILRQEELDEMLAASIAAEESEGFGIAASTSGALGKEVFDEDDHEDEEMILPEMHGKVDPAVLASLPPSMQLDLLVQMRERLMAENRQKYQKVKKAPAKFSELQIEAYLKTVAFRREIDGVQKSAAGRGIGGVQTSRIASEANREFIFSSTFTGDKQALTSVGQEKNKADHNLPPPVESSANAVNKDQRTKKSDAAAGPGVAESEEAFHDDLETYLDERGRVRVSRVRALGIRMTRDLQRNLDLMKEMDQVIVENNEEGNNESATTDNSSGVLDDSCHRLLQPEATYTNNGTDTEVDKMTEPVVSQGASIEISFEDISKPDEYDDNDDDLFSRLVAGDPVTNFSVDNSRQSLRASSDNEWEEGVIEGKSTEYRNEVEGINDEEDVEWEEGDENQKHLAAGSMQEAPAFQELNIRRKEDMKGDRSMDDFHENHASVRKSIEYLNVEDMSDEEEVQWEEGSLDVQLKILSRPRESNTTVTKGALEEEALLQEAIRRSLEDISGWQSMNFQEIQTSERARGIGGEKTDVSTSADDVHRPFGSTIDLDNICSGKKTSSFIAASPERANLNPMFLNQNAVESGALAGEVVLGTETLPGGDAKEQLLDTYSEDLAASNENVVHNRSSSAFTCSSHDSLLDSGSADAKTIFPAELDTHLCSSENPGKASADDSAILVDELGKNGVEGSCSMETEVERNYFQDHKILEDRLEGEMSFLGKEREELGSEQRRHERDAESVNNEMFTECQELLQMFGLPYIIAPMEAEAQCAFMELSNLVDGVVTDDSDAFLFGSQCVYKNIFDDRKYVETYLMKDIENELGLDREKLIHMALLLGSDYTEGISGVGIVNAIEVVNAFQGKDGLREFREWIESPDPSILGKKSVEVSKDSDDSERKKQIFKNKHRNVSKNWHVSSTFPSDAVISAYVSPQVDKSTEPFAWGRPDLFALRRLCWEKFAWGSSKADELLVPVLKEYNKHETQLRMESFYTFNERFAKIRSKRIEKAVKGITASKSSASRDEAPQQSTKKSKKRKTNPQEDEVNQLEGDSVIVDGATTSNQDNTTKTPVAEPLKKGQTRRRNSRRVLGESSGGRQRGRGRGRGRGRKKADTGTNYDDTNSSENDEEMQFHKSDEAPQLRRSRRPRKTVKYNASDEHNNPDKEGVPFLEEGTQSKESPVDQETGDADKSIRDPVNEGEDVGMGGRLPSDEAETTQGMDEMGRSLIDDVQTEHPSHHGQETEDYLQFGGGFCAAEDEDEENQESNPVATPKPSNEDIGAPYNALNMDGYTSISDVEDDPENFNPMSLRAMPNLRKKRRID